VPILLALAALLLSAGPGPQQVLPSPPACRSLPDQPGHDWRLLPAPDDAARVAAVEALDRFAFQQRAPDRKGIRTDGLLVLRGGAIVHERYADGFDLARPHVAWSCAKSLTAALAGVAVARGALDLDASICRLLPVPGATVANDRILQPWEALQPRCDITARHLLQLASGLDWNETYEGKGLQASSVLAMLYGVGRADMAGFVRSHRSRAPPGERFNYSSGDSVLLAAVVGAALSPGLGSSWPAAALFEPLGMESAVLERDAAGTVVGSSLWHATPRDLARLGLLYLADGCWGGERLLPPGFVAASTALSAPSRAGAAAGRAGDRFGLGWWLNRPVPELGLPAPWAGVPEDAFAARGHWGQLIAVVPSLGLVVVRTADDREAGAFDLGRFLTLAIAAGRGP
jgi:CubicO group peptidase (beta-lactamase class C family)